MAELKSPRSDLQASIDRRWIGAMYSAFALTLLAFASLQDFSLLAQFPSALALWLGLIVATPITAMRIGRARAADAVTVALLVVDAVIALALVAATGGHASPLWVGLLLVSTAAPLLLPGRQAVVLISVVWLVYGMFVVAAPPEARAEAFLEWALRAAGVALVALVLFRALAAEELLRRRAEQREHVLRKFLTFSARSRVSDQPWSLLEAVAHTAQTSGDFDCVTISHVDSVNNTATVAVAYGASGRRLYAVEGLTCAWSQFAALLTEANRFGDGSFQTRTLPFRTIQNELHLVVPLTSHDGTVQGIMTVSYPAKHAHAIGEARNLLELLADQAAAVLDDSGSYASLAHRVAEATTTLDQSRNELTEARDRAETLYQLVQGFTRTLDEREVLTQALVLVQRAVAANEGAVLLLEPNTGHLTLRTGGSMLSGVLL